MKVSVWKERVFAFLFLLFHNLSNAVSVLDIFILP